jgi:hypothetical protein
MTASIGLTLLLALGAIDVGSGKDGDLKVDAGVSLMVNVSTPLVADAPAGTGTLSVGDSLRFHAGQLLLVVQMKVPLLPQPSDAGVIDLSATSVGDFEFASVLSVTGSEVALAAPLTRGFSSTSSQVLVVPEFRRAAVDGTVLAPQWDGRSGGLLVMLVSEELTGSGTLSVAGRGFRAAPPVTSTGIWVGSPREVHDAGALAAGESLLSEPAWGPGAAVLGGGSGGLTGGAGGGASHSGRGGAGSSSGDGEAGYATAYAPRSKLIMGSGGGLLGEDTSYWAARPEVGAGGGVLWVRTARLSGALAFDASGGASSLHGGASGGLVRIESATTVACRFARASGANGANGGGRRAGGGGAGGRIVVVGAIAECPMSVAAGLGGTEFAGRVLPPYETIDPKAVGDVILIPSSEAPPTPRILSPANLATVSSDTAVGGVVPGGSSVGVRLHASGVRSGEGTTDVDGAFVILPSGALKAGWNRLTVTAFSGTDESPPSAPVYVLVAAADGGVDLPPNAQPGGPLRFLSFPTTSATCGTPYSYSEAGAPKLNHDDGLSFTLEAIEGAPLPEGFAIDVTTGILTWRPPPAFRGVVPLRLIARRLGERADQDFAIRVACDTLRVGCAAEPSRLSLLGILGAGCAVLALFRWRR